MTEPHITYHADGSIWGKGSVQDGKMQGYWEWFRKDGSKMRSGHFNNDKQVGEWITYNRQGDVHKITYIQDGLDEKRK
ncbi:MAG TPA: hypothetical protein VM581_04275 [Magnetospirillaceae bacterium]|nr:hypothetical protein [Magnetospirillaceae bacterium]